MQIAKVDKYTFDVFGDTGFDNWTRIRQYPWGYKVVNGIRLEKAVFDEVCAKLRDYPRGSFFRNV